MCPEVLTSRTLQTSTFYSGIVASFSCKAYSAQTVSGKGKEEAKARAKKQC